MEKTGISLVVYFSSRSYIEAISDILWKFISIYFTTFKMRKLSQVF